MDDEFDPFEAPDFEAPDLDDPAGAQVLALLAELVRQGKGNHALLSERLIPALERIAAALERTGGPAAASAASDGVDALRARLEASRSANDPEAVLALRDELARHLAAEALGDLDRDLARWLIRLIQRRMRAGTVRADVVQLAARVAERFGGTVEGASLRASLPTLRRSAGLCPVCGEPYTGLQDRCPRCQAALAAAGPPPIEPDQEQSEGSDP